MQPTRKPLTTARRLVIKLGSNVVAKPNGQINTALIRRLASEIAGVEAAGKEIILISSGAVRVGSARLGRQTRPDDLPARQAAATVGQGELIAAYRSAFARHNQPIGQILLTQADIADSRRYLHLRNTLFSLRDLGVIPILNENDPLTIRGLEIGENDRLAALVAAKVDADLVVLLSDVEGFFTCDPRQDPSAELIHEVTRLTPQLCDRAAGPAGGGRGGMRSKLEAARAAMKSGVYLVIVRGSLPNALSRVLAGEEIGTLFVPEVEKLRSRKRWIGFALAPRGQVIVDAGARRALMERGSSLLPVGVREVLGDFRQGDAVSIVADGEEIARGLVNYSAEEVRAMRGCHSREIAARIGYRNFDEVIHRDNLVVLTS
jgi:glutamate 5-kinase